mgnify:CR=1 FL=1
MRFTVRDEVGKASQNALCYVNETATTTAVDDMFAAASGGSAITTLTSNSQGEIVGWFDESRTVDIKVTDNTDAAFYVVQPAIPLSFTDISETIQVQASATNVAVASPSGVAATDSAAIQAAIDAVVTAGGGTIELRSGAYALGTTSLTIGGHNVNIEGRGRLATKTSPNVASD